MTIIKTYGILLALLFSTITSAQNMIYQFRDDFNNNANNWKIANTADYSCNISNSYLSINNKVDKNTYYFRPNENAIPKSAKYEITANMIFNFGSSGFSGGFIFIRNENVFEDGSYDSIQDDFRVVFLKRKGESKAGLEIKGKVIGAIPLNIDLVENKEYIVKLIIDNTIDKESIQIKIDGQIVATANEYLFDFTKIGIISYPYGGVKVNSLDIKSYDGILKYPFDIFSYKWDEASKAAVRKTSKELEVELLPYIPQELLDYQRTLQKQDVDVFFKT